jgi:Tfp pilus assembly protein PilF
LAAECQRALEAKDYAGARATAAEALQLDPQYEEAWVAFGMASVRLGEPDKARQAYERALALHQSSERQRRPDASQVYQEVFLLSLLSRYTEAQELLRRARADFPTDPQLSTLADLFPEFIQGWGGWTVKSP